MAEENVRYIVLQRITIIVRHGDDEPTVTVVKPGDGALTLTPAELAALIGALYTAATLVKVPAL